jgi:serine/threonine protein kinase, bacterial
MTSGHFTVIGITVKPGAFDDWPKSRESLVKLRHLVRRELASLTSVIAPGDRLRGESWGVSDMSEDGEGGKRRPWIVIGGLALVVVLAIGGVTAWFLLQHKDAPRQVVLPFPGVREPYGVAVDTAGNVFIADANNTAGGDPADANTNRVLKLPAGAATAFPLPLNGLKNPSGVAVDTTGTVYIADANNNRVLKLPAGSTTPTELPFTGLNNPSDVEVDSAENVYVADANNNRVLKLPAGSTTQTQLPLTGLNNPSGVAADSVGNVYVTDYANHRVLKLPAGSTTQVELPFSGLNLPEGVAVDAAGNVYVTDYWNNRVLKLPAGSNTALELPFTGLSHPEAVAVDTAGNVYVADYGNYRVLKLPAA